MQDTIGFGDSAACAAICAPAAPDEMPEVFATFTIECVGPDGVVKWKEIVRNTVLNAGKTHLLDTYLKGSAYTAAWYLVLKGAGTIAAGDTLASHAGWTELTPYAGSNRPSITWGTTSGTPASNAATAVSISINATATVAGAGICTAQTGTSGTLYNMSDFGASRSVASGDTLNVTPTISTT